MFRTYHTTADMVSIKLVEDIKRRFPASEKLTITVSSDKPDNASDRLLEFLEIEKSFPPRSVPKSLDFDDVVREINL